MTRPDAVRFLLGEPTMAFPEGRLLAVRQDRLHVLAANGWTTLGRSRPANARGLSREEAEQWCERHGTDRRQLATVPDLGSLG